MSRKKSGAELMRRGSGEAKAFARMYRAGNFDTAIVYVEGDSDINFYRCIVDRDHVELVQMKGKNDAMIAAADANRARRKGVLAIVDSDFDHILGMEPVANVIRTDTHDIETLMISNKAFEYAKYSYVNMKKLNNSVYDVESLWNKVIEIAKVVGKIRLLSMKNNWNMKFSFEGIRKRDNLKDAIIKGENGEINFDVRNYIYKCVYQVHGCNVEVGPVEKAFNDDVNEYDTWQICRGHDISMIISILYSTGFYGKHDVSRNEVENMIASTYIASRKFKKSKMYEAIKKWQNDNLGWKILSMHDIIARISGIPEDMVDDIIPTDSCSMWVISTRDKHYGATCLLSEHVLERIAETIGTRDYWIIPSSISEIIALPADKLITSSDLLNMVREVNSTQVAPEEQLDTAVYAYTNGLLARVA